MSSHHPYMLISYLLQSSLQVVTFKDCHVLIKLTSGDLEHFLVYSSSSPEFFFLTAPSLFSRTFAPDD